MTQSGHSPIALEPETTKGRRVRLGGRARRIESRTTAQMLSLSTSNLADRLLSRQDLSLAPGDHVAYRRTLEALVLKGEPDDGSQDEEADRDVELPSRSAAGCRSRRSGSSI